MIQVAQVLFMLVSGLGALFLTNSLHVFEACVLFVLHGCAGALWTPANRWRCTTSSARGPTQRGAAERHLSNFGILFGPAVGGALLFLAGPTYGIFVNALIYLPLSIIVHRLHLCIGRPRVRGTSLRGHRTGAGARQQPTAPFC